MSTNTMIHPTLAWIEARMADASTDGWCTACGATQSGVEPDAHHYRCEACGCMNVHGAEHLLLRGWVQGEGDAPAREQRRKVAQAQRDAKATKAYQEDVQRRIEAGRILSDHFALAVPVGDDRSFHPRRKGLSLIHRQSGLAAVVTNRRRERRRGEWRWTYSAPWRTTIPAWQVLADRLEEIGAPSGLWDLSDMTALLTAQLEALSKAEEAVQEWIQEHQPPAE